MSTPPNTAFPRDGFTSPGGQPAVPIVLGAVGHRELRDQDVEALKAVIKTQIQAFLAAYPHTPLVVLSSLAEGADLLVAGVARELGVFVRVPLPFPPDAYRASTSFSCEPSRVEFDRLTADPGVEAFVVPLPTKYEPKTIDWNRVATDQVDPHYRALRHDCYENAGGFIVRRCHVLLALWDGKEPDPQHPSGTAYHVAFKLWGQAPGNYPWKDAEPLGFRGERGPVLVIHTPRDDADPQGSTRRAGGVQVFVPSEEPDFWDVPQTDLPLPRYLSRGTRFRARLWQALRLGPHSRRHGHAVAREPWVAAELRQFRETCTLIEDLNRDVDHPAVVARIQQQLREKRTTLSAGHFDDRHEHWLLRLSRVHEAADARSMVLQVHERWLRAGVFLLLGISVLALDFYLHEVDVVVVSPARGEKLHSPGSLLGFVVLLVLATALVIGDLWTSLNQRRLDSRALAEGLRVRRAWALAGIGRSVADSYLGQLRSELSWIRLAIQHVCPPPRVWADHFETLPHAQKRALLETVQAEWVGNHALDEPKGQLQHYRKAHRREHRAATLGRGLGIALAFGGWALLMALLLQDARRPSELVLIAASFAVIVGGLIIAYNERESREELAKQYERMELVFENGSRELSARLANDDIVGGQRVIEALGREAIMEHSQWLILRRSRPMEIHIG